MNPEQVVTTMNEPEMTEQSVRDAVAFSDSGPMEFAIVDVMGHQRFVGKLSEQLVAGTPFVRVDSLNPDFSIRSTKLIGASSIYMISPITIEEIRSRLAPAEQPVMLTDRREVYHHDDDDDADEEDFDDYP